MAPSGHAFAQLLHDVQASWNNDTVPGGRNGFTPIKPPSRVSMDPAMIPAAADTTLFRNFFLVVISEGRIQRPTICLSIPCTRIVLVERVVHFEIALGPRIDPLGHVALQAVVAFGMRGLRDLFF